MTATWTGIRYHLVKGAGKRDHRARLVAIEDKYGTKGWRCVACGYERPFKDEDER